MLKNIVTLKSTLGVTQGRCKWYHWSMVSYSHSIATMAISLAVLKQYTNVMTGKVVDVNNSVQPDVCYQYYKISSLY